MWISIPTPVISRTMTIESGSRRIPNGTYNGPALIQSYRMKSTVRPSAGSASIWTKITSAIAKAITITPLAINPAWRPRRMKRMLINTPINGSTISRDANVSSIVSPGSVAARLAPSADRRDRWMASGRQALAMHRADIVHVRRAFRPEDSNQQRQTNGHFGCCDGDHEKGHDLPVDARPLSRESYQRQISRVEHKLARHKDHHHIAARKHAKRSNRKEHSA